MDQPYPLAAPAPGLRWLRFYAVLLPAISAIAALDTALSGRSLETAGAFGLGLLPSALVAFGLWRRRAWGYALNFIVLAFDLVGFALLDQDDCKSVVLRFAIVTSAWGIPNFLYFKRRRHLFH